MEFLDRLKKDKPFKLAIAVDGRDEPHEVRIKGGKGQANSWNQVGRLLDNLDWTGIETYNKQDEIIGAYGADENESPAEETKEPDALDPRLTLNPEDPDVAKYKVITSAQIAVLERFNQLAEISFGKQDQLFDLVLDRWQETVNRLEETQQKLMENQEVVGKKLIENAKSQAEMEQAMGGLFGMIQKIAPDIFKDLAQGFIGNMFGGGSDKTAQVTDGGNGVKNGE